VPEAISMGMLSCAVTIKVYNNTTDQAHHYVQPVSQVIDGFLLTLGSHALNALSHLVHHNFDISLRPVTESLSHSFWGQSAPVEDPT
jgi:hypothetical protein